MVRAPYPARIAAGLIVTAIEETRKLPTLLITLPMTAISQTLQAGMRAQQGIAELAIKGDEALELLFDHPDEEPEWAHFDDELTDTTITDTERESAPPADSEPPVADTDVTDADTTDVTDTDATVPATNEAPAPNAPSADSGRFALYSSAPEDVIAAADEPGPADSPAVDAPDIVEYLDYNTVTLAQLRAKLRTVNAHDLRALLAYEQATRNRAPFVTMLDNRITAAEHKRTPAT